MKIQTIIIIVLALLFSVLFLQQRSAKLQLPKGETKPLVTYNNPSNLSNKDGDVFDVIVKVEDIPGLALKNSVDNNPQKQKGAKQEQKDKSQPRDGSVDLPVLKSRRDIFVTDDVKHSVPLDEIRQGCFGRDCIPSVDDPEFVSITEANKILPEDTVGIGLVYKGEIRFYPFNMLVTREIVNDTVAGDPLVVTYCPLCGTGIVFNREIDGKVYEFGVSGMLWQSNLLMYNRVEDEDKISLWSQVLGEAVLGVDTGVKLSIVRSDIVRYVDWRVSHAGSKVLNTGRIGDPYGGDYYRVAQSFSPSFDESSSPLEPTTYVLGIEVNGKYKAYVKDSLAEGVTVDKFNGISIEITKSSDGEVDIINSTTGENMSTIEGFWFSWFAVHPNTELLK